MTESSQPVIELMGNRMLGKALVVVDGAVYAEVCLAYINEVDEEIAPAMVLKYAKRFSPKQLDEILRQAKKLWGLPLVESDADV